jgi:hypothetical protein
MAPIRVSAVTALYDIGREQIDGRSIEQYVGWLNTTLQLPISFTIFLDPAIDPSRIYPKSGDHLIVSPLQESEFFEFLPRVEAIAATRKRFLRPKKFVYRLPRYGLVQFSKFSFMRRVAESGPDADAVFWIDAGISRFSPEGKRAVGPDGNYLGAQLARGGVSLSITPVLQAERDAGGDGRRYTGTSARLVSGGMFLQPRGIAAANAAMVHAFLDTEWLKEGRWDNDEVALGEMILRDRLKVNTIAVSTRFDDFLRAAFIWEESV